MPLSDEIKKNGNSGLNFNKFANAWDWEQDPRRFLIFDKPDLNKKSWIKQFSGAVGKVTELQEFAQRYYAMVLACGGFCVALKNETRFVTGLGLQHPTENGFAWHHSLGVPYLPGTGVKGVVKSYCIEENVVDTMPFFYGGVEKAETVGQFCFLDLVPVKPPKVCSEILTPHYRDYYSQGAVPPGDWCNPNPVEFLAVDSGAEWLVGVIPTRPMFASRNSKLQDLVVKAFTEYGAGAKTSIGMGYFSASETSLQRFENAIVAERQAKEKVEAQRSLHPQLQFVIQRSESEVWSKDPGHCRDKALQLLLEFETSNAKLKESVVAWIRKNVLDETTNKTLWANPNEKTGKNKDKDKYNKKLVAIVELIKKLIK